MKKRLIITLAWVFCFAGMYSQDLSAYEKHWYVNGSDTLPYRLLLPENYNPSKKYPLLLFLHGAGERGNDNEMQLVHGAKLFLRQDVRDDFPAIIVFPQCAANSFWANVDFKINDQTGKRELSFPAEGPPSTSMRLVQQLMDELMDKYKVKEKQVYVGGLSMGGMGTFEIVRRNPNLFAAAIPICGGGNPATATQMKKVKWWVFHGAKDDVVPPQLSEVMVAALEQAGASVKFTLYPEANHNSWDPAFADPGLLKWLFAQKRK